MKKLSIDQIKSGVLIGKPEPITVEVKVDGETCEFDCLIMPFSYATAVAQMQAFGEKKETLAGILASVIVHETTEEVINERNESTFIKKFVETFTANDIRERFNQALVDAIWTKVVEINMLGKKPSSTTKTGSSSKSASQQGAHTRKRKRSNTVKSKNMKPTLGDTEASTLGDESSKK